MINKYHSIYLICCSFLIGCQSPQEIKKEQYVVAGQALYLKHCANCHQADGNGLANLYPPINSSSLTDTRLIARLIRSGSKSTLRTQKMPPNSDLKDLDIAQILTYLNIKWTENKIIVETTQVSKWIK